MTALPRCAPHSLPACSGLVSRAPRSAGYLLGIVLAAAAPAGAETPRQHTGVSVRDHAGEVFPQGAADSDKSSQGDAEGKSGGDFLGSVVDNFRFSGFASFGAGRVDREGLRFADYDEEWSVDSDSLLGLQAQTRLLERLDLTAQVVARGFSYNGRDAYQPAFNWLFLSYQLAPEIQVRGGRMRTPHYLYSDTLEVGYSYVWVRPPVDVYTPLFEPLSEFDGADIRFSRELHMSENLQAEGDLQLYGGQLEDRFTTIELDGETLLGMNTSVTFEHLKLRYALMALELDIASPTFAPLIDGFNALTAVDPAFADLAADWSQDDGWFYYHGLGLQYSLDRLLVTTEWYAVNGPDEGFSTDATGWYLSVQHTWGRMTPYAVIGEYRSLTNPAIVDSINASFAVLPAGVLPAADALRQAARFAAESFNVKERTLTLGLRVDFMTNLAVKGEWQTFRFADDSTGHFFPDDPAVQPDRASLLSLVVDVVF